MTYQHIAEQFLLMRALEGAPADEEIRVERCKEHKQHAELQVVVALQLEGV